MFLLTCDPVFAPMISSSPSISMVLLSVIVSASDPPMLSVRRAHRQNGSNLASRKMVRPTSPTSRAVETFDGGKTVRICKLRVFCSEGGGGSHRLYESLYRAATLLFLDEDRTSDVIGDGERGIIPRDQQHAAKQVFQGPDVAFAKAGRRPRRKMRFGGSSRRRTAGRPGAVRGHRP
jgi:hypothetical protein